MKCSTFYQIATIIAGLLFSFATCKKITTAPGCADPDYCEIDPGVADYHILIFPDAAFSGYPKQWALFTNGIPNHLIGEFGGSMALCHRPDELIPRDTVFVFPTDPGISSSSTLDHVFFTIPDFFGAAVNGIPFDPFAAEYTTCSGGERWQKNAMKHPDMDIDLDCNNAHIQPDNDYHYHGLPIGLYKVLGGTYPIPNVITPSGIGKEEIILLGWGLDGIPVYGPLCLFDNPMIGGKNWWQPRSGYTIRTMPTAGCVPSDAGSGYYEEDYEYTGGAACLDECNGHFAPTPKNLNGEYHYHITENYPNIPRCHSKPL